MKQRKQGSSTERGKDHGFYQENFNGQKSPWGILMQKFVTETSLGKLCLA